MSATRRIRNAYSEAVSPNGDAVAQVQIVLTRVDAQLDILRTFVAALARGGVSPAALAGVTAHLDQLQAAASALAAHPEITASELHSADTS